MAPIIDGLRVREVRLSLSPDLRVQPLFRGQKKDPRPVGQESSRSIDPYLHLLG
jgi:hypothetical protein